MVSSSPLRWSMRWAPTVETSRHWRSSSARSAPPEPSPPPDDYPPAVSSKPARLDVVIEAGTKKTFASAVEWPGWSRSGKTRDAAIDTLLAYTSRYAPVARLARVEFAETVEVEVVQRLPGG